MDVIALNEQRESISGNGKKLGFKLTKEEIKAMSFTARAKKFLPYIDFDRARIANLNTISTRMKRLFPKHRPHELRHTFITRCQECGVPREVVSVWAGHAADSTKTSNVYTHFS